MDIPFDMAAQDIASGTTIIGLAIMIGGLGVAAGKTSRTEIANSSLAQGLFGVGCVMFVAGLAGGFILDAQQMLTI